MSKKKTARKVIYPNKRLLETRQLISDKEEMFFDKYPTCFRAARLACKVIKEAAKKENREPNWSSFFPFASFENDNVKQTKRNLRMALRKNARERKVFLDNGIPYSSTVYSNPVVQSFFEFSLFYAWVKNKKLSAKKAKTIFLKMCEVSLDRSLEKKEETEIVKDFLLFITGQKGVFNHSKMSAYQSGRKPKAKTQEIVRLMKRGRKDGQIADIRINDGKLDEQIKKYISDGVEEWLANKLVRREEMNRLAATRSKYFPKDKTAKKS